ncbi:MAG: hypothetical protein ACRDBP_05000 [Luteolibacter sp.]
MKSIVCCTLFLLSIVQAAPPKARVVPEPARKTHFISNQTANPAANKAKPATPKVVAARPIPSKSWRWVPKFQKSGRDDTLWGFLLRKPF